MCGSLCVFVDRWPKKGSDLRHFWPASECLEGPFCLFWCENHTKSCARENLRGWKRKTKDVGQLGVRLRNRDSEIQALDAGWSVGSKTWIQSSLRAVWSEERRHRAVMTVSRDESVSLVSYVGFSQSSRDSHTYIQRMIKNANFTFLRFAVLNPC